MSNKIKRIGFGLDPAIENLKPVLSEIEGSKIENRDGWSRREFLSTEALAGSGALGIAIRGNRRRCRKADEERIYELPSYSPRISQ